VSPVCLSVFAFFRQAEAVVGERELSTDPTHFPGLDGAGLPHFSLLKIVSTSTPPCARDPASFRLQTLFECIPLSQGKVVRRSRTDNPLHYNGMLVNGRRQDASPFPEMGFPRWKPNLAKKE